MCLFPVVLVLPSTEPASLFLVGFVVGSSVVGVVLVGCVLAFSLGVVVGAVFAMGLWVVVVVVCVCDSIGVDCLVVAFEFFQEGVAVVLGVPLRDDRWGDGW